MKVGAGIYPPPPHTEFEIGMAALAGCTPDLVRDAIGNLFDVNLRMADTESRRKSKEDRDQILAAAAAFERARNIYAKIPETTQHHISHSDFDEFPMMAEVDRLIEALHREATISEVPWKSFQEPGSNRANWRGRMVASAVARVFTAAGTNMTVGKSFDGEPSTAFARAVKYMLEQFGVAADWRTAAEWAKREAGSRKE